MNLISVKKEKLGKTVYNSEKNKYKTLPNSVKRIKTINLNKSKINTLKKGLDLYEKMINSKNKKMQFFKKEKVNLYKSINFEIEK